VLERSRGTTADKATAPGFKGAATQPAVGQNYRFQVTGTNRSLNRKVVFSGNLMADERATDTNRLAPSNLSFTQSRISGKAVVGAGTELEINAVPAK
jgi:hypothetical protein